jgi:type I restriction enzyme M protein
MVALPGQLFYSTSIKACLWFIARNKNNGRYRDRRGETLFIDARKMGKLEDKSHRELSEDDIMQITSVYHSWRGDKGSGIYSDVPGFCKKEKTSDLSKQEYVLAPSSYVGIAPKENEDYEPYEDKMKRLTQQLYAQFEESSRLEKVIKGNLTKLGFPIVDNKDTKGC